MQAIENITPHPRTVNQTDDTLEVEAPLTTADPNKKLLVYAQGRVVGRNPHLQPVNFLLGYPDLSK